VSDLTEEQRARVDETKNHIRRQIQQMISSGRHDAGSIKVALQEILEVWG